MTRATRGLLAVGCLVVVTTPACAVEQAVPAPACDGGGSLLIAAQSVPDATLVPCLGRLPEGWSVSAVRIDESGTRVELDSDRAGLDAAVLEYRDRCDVRGATETPSDLWPATRHETIESLRPEFRAVRAYVFEGGCVSWRFDFSAGVSATESVAVGDALSLVSRADLQASVSEVFVDEEL